MFRRLLALETAALRGGDVDPACAAGRPVTPDGSVFHEFARFAAIPSCYGMWSSRSAL